MPFYHLCKKLSAGFALAVFLGGCSLFGMGPSEHTVVDYESLEPARHGANTPEQYRYGHSDRRHDGTGIERETPTYEPPSESDTD